MHALPINLNIHDPHLVFFLLLQSLFPQNVKQQLLHESAQEGRAAALTRQTSGNSLNAKPKVSTMKSTMETLISKVNQANQSDNARRQDDEEEEQLVQIPTSKPIADVFEAATVLFCDLVGFTCKNQSL